MNKSELVDTVASRAGVAKSQAESVLNEFFETVKTETKGGEKVGWPGFGNFSTKQASARTGRNPQTGAPVKVPARTQMKFAPSQTLKDALNAKGGAKKATAKKAPAKKATAKKATAKKAGGAKKAAKRR